MPRPICVQCAVEMQCAKNEFLVKDQAIGGFPSTYWSGDLWECPVCHQKIVMGFGGKISQEEADKRGIASEVFEFRCDPHAIRYLG